MNQSLGSGAASASKEDTPQATAFTEAICAHLGGRAPNTPAADPKVGMRLDQATNAAGAGQARPGRARPGYGRAGNRLKGKLHDRERDDKLGWFCLMIPHYNYI